MAEGQILFAIYERTCFIKVLGEAKYSTTTGFGDFIDTLFSRSDFDDILVDLSETTYIDSTNLGELARISTFLMQRRNRRPFLISTQPNISAIISNLGINHIFEMTDTCPSLPEEMSAIPKAEMSSRENAERILRAHRCLMAINEKTGKVFRSVVEALEEELGLNTGRAS